MKKILAYAFVFLAGLSLLPSAALAANHTLLDGDSLNVSTWTVTHADSSVSTLSVADGDSITITDNAAVIVTGSTSRMVGFICQSNAKLTLSDIAFDRSANFGGLSVIRVAGTDVKIILKGTNTLRAPNVLSGYVMPTISIPSGSSLEIYGDGALNVYAGGEAAAIGGNYMDGLGVLTISGGTIHAEASDIYVSGAAIGLGYRNSYAGGEINITGGTVTAVSHVSSAGIGSGMNNSVSKINISGGVVYARGGTDSAGIGSGVACPTAGTIVIEGDAMVYAAKGAEGIYASLGNTCDLGHGGVSSVYEVVIRGTSKVFLENNTSDPVTTSTHNHEPGILMVGVSDMTGVGGVYRFASPTAPIIWENAKGGYYVPPISPTPVDTDIPQTGDHNGIALMILALCAGASLLVVALFWRGKSKQDV